MPQPSTTSDAPLGTFEEQVMLAVMRTRRTEDGAYGMAIRRELEDVTGREVAIGAVYATLDRLEAKELVASERGESAAGASRRMFAVTPRGARALADSREMRERLWLGVDLVPLLGTAKARGGA
ncbi:MAG TPA: helix-turn-helix transcriptional regulator [Longimicrobium sp.]|nr:helix-turn-helix transcriptional regulator [Longimicrobium sp.]